MHIDAVELFHLVLPLRRPPQAPWDRFGTLETVLVRMHSGGASGWGEAAPGNAPLAGPEWAAGAFALLRDWLAPAVVRADIESGDALQQRLAPLRGNPNAKGALDAAWWDLRARQQGKPLAELLGGCRRSVELGATFDRMDSIDAFLDALGAAFEAGFARAKLKIRPGWDVRMIEMVRRQFPTETLFVDFEGALDLGHMEMLHRLDDFSLELVEQPLPADDLVGHAMVRESVRTPVCLDEGIATVAQAEMAMDLKSCGYVNLKPGRVGGLTPALAIHDLCRRHEVPCYVGAVPQTAVGVRAGLALATLPNCAEAADFFPSEEFLEADPAPAPLPSRDPSDGRLRVALWSEPGLGADVDAGLLEKYAIARARVTG